MMKGLGKKKKTRTLSDVLIKDAMLLQALLGPYT